ncbi:MAG: CBS domain-containing protein [Sedimentisphaerales bacterium]|nr:CBS domain-containing protein [Sedimentisphaerales bacterium]
MDPDPPVVSETCDLPSVLQAFADCQSDILPVVDASGALLGIVSLSTLRPVLAAGDMHRWLLVHDLMTPAPASLTEKTNLLDAQEAFDTTKAEALPVLAEGTRRLVGIANRHRLDRKVQTEAAEWLAARQAAKGG